MQSNEYHAASAREQELSAIYENVPGILFYVSIEPNGQFRFQSMSQAGLSAIGLTREQVVGAFVHDVIPLLSRNLVLNNYRKAIQSGQTVRWKEVSFYPTGRKIGEVAVTPLYDSNGVATHLIGIVHDITEREQLEQLLLKQRDEAHHHELKLLLETATQGIVSVNANGSILTSNRALETMFGWPYGALIGKSIEVLVPSGLRVEHKQYRETYFASPRARLMGGGLTLMGERRDGSTFPIEVSLNHVGTPSTGHAFAFITDITERKEAENALTSLTGQLISAQEDERRRIAREVHDDYQQRLAIVANEVDKLRQDVEATNAEAGQELLELWNEVSELAADLHSLSHRLHSSTLETLGLVPGISAFCREFEEQQGLHVEFNAENVPRTVPSDIALCLFRVTQEALRNAKRHSGANSARVGLRCEQEKLHLSVSDNGRGFQVRMKYSSSGIGIRSMQERLRLVGGQLLIRSKSSEGTTIEAWIPFKVTSDR